jgi:tetratricopeptide (TPR) repeat protein
VEQENIRREFRLDEPLMAADLRLWMEVPDGGPLRPSSAEALKALASAFEAIPESEPSSTAGPKAGEETPFDPAILSLSSANRAQRNQWIVLYDRGLLYYRKGNYQAAARDLQTALKALRPYRNTASAIVREAEIHTHYALGHALNRGGEGEPQDQQAEQRKEVIHSFRNAALGLRNLWEMRTPAYDDVPYALTFYLRPTGLATSSIWGDLIAAYLRAPEYHDSEEQPQQEPCESLDRNAETYYRDSSFCRSEQRAGGDLAAPFSGLFHRFYGKDKQAWAEENRLWALSNAVDLDAENSGNLGDDPYLLYNLGSLLIQVGALKAAPRYLTQAIESASEIPSDDYDRIARLSTVAKVLAGDTPGKLTRRQGNRTNRTPSSLRAKYLELYEKDAPIKVTPFPAVGDSFEEPDAEALIDRWLFLHLWRKLLEAGDFERFTREYDRLMAQEGVFKDFFRQWHDEVLTDLGNRALQRAERHEQAGERDRARLIRMFLSDNDHFPNEIRRKARGLWGWFTWVGRAAGLWTIAAVVFIPLLLVLVAAHALARAHKRTFFSAHRLARKGGEAYPR